ncbi:MAG: HAMP domain-containing histidine kinase [Acidobacteria bacterium]|nr:HAMP domain-containing histidine kinase [Acidobacteriota bacterium]
MRLRTKFLLSVVLISSLLTAAVLLLVRYRVQLRVRDEVSQALEASVLAFGRAQQQRALMLERSAALLAALPPLKAVMTSGDTATIQDASEPFWRLAGSQVLALADRSGHLSGFHATAASFSRSEAQAAIDRYIAGGSTRDWWSGGGHLFQVFLQPISIGPPESSYPIGLLAVGYEIDRGVAADLGSIGSSEVAFGYDGTLMVTTLPSHLQQAVGALLAPAADASGTRDVRLGQASFRARTVDLSQAGGAHVTLAVLKSVDEPAAFLADLNRWIAAIGALAVLAGALLAFTVAARFTRPLGELVAGVEALERGDFEYPLEPRGSDEAARLTASFDRMRSRLRESQRTLLETERLATIGRVARSLSHDLRHPLTSIQAYAEFLAERELTPAQRRDYMDEIRIAVSRMTDEINALLAFASEQPALQCTVGRLDEAVDRAVRTVKSLPEYESLDIAVEGGGPCGAAFDPGKFERVMLNLLFNAAEAVPPTTGRLRVRCSATPHGAHVRVIDNGPGIPPSILDTVFEPLVSHGKPSGTGLGLAIVRSIMQQHGGEATVEATGPTGTTFLLQFPPS